MLAKFKGDTGKSNPMTVITPIRRRVTWLLRFAWWILGTRKLTDLRGLRFIHFARWVIVRRTDFRAIRGCPARENLRYDYALFSTNFNNRWEQYIDAFALVVPRGVDWLWSLCRRFPGAWPIRLFKIYIRYNEYPTRYYYNAYPEASVRDIEAAQRLREELVGFLARSRDMDPKTFALEYHEFTRRVQNDLAAARPPAGMDREPWPTFLDLQPLNLETL